MSKPFDVEQYLNDLFLIPDTDTQILACIRAIKEIHDKESDNEFAIKLRDFLLNFNKKYENKKNS